MRIFPFVLPCLLVVLLGCDRPDNIPYQTGEPSAEELSIRAGERARMLLPGVEPTEGIQPQGQAALYFPTDLYGLLQEETDTYLRFGLVVAADQSFFVLGHKLRCNLFDLGEPARAHALFMWLSSPQTRQSDRDLSVGAGKLCTWKGRYVVLITEVTPEAQDAADKLAQVVLSGVSPGEPSDLFTALRSVLTQPQPRDMKIVFSESELMNAGPLVGVPYYSGKDILSLEVYGQTHPVMVALASVDLSPTTIGPTVFALARYPHPDKAQEAMENYRQVAQGDKNPEIKDAVIRRQGEVLGIVWRSVGNSGTRLDQMLARLAVPGTSPQAPVSQ